MARLAGRSFVWVLLGLLTSDVPLVMLHVVWTLWPRVCQVPIVAEVLVIAVANPAIAARRLRLLDGPNHS